MAKSGPDITSYVTVKRQDTQHYQRNIHLCLGTYGGASQCLGTYGGASQCLGTYGGASQCLGTYGGASQCIDGFLNVTT